MKNRIITGIFIIYLLIVFVFNIVIPDREVSWSERRYLETMPKLTVESVFKGKFFDEFEKYQLDQMLLRDSFRMFKAVTEYSIFKKFDNNDIFIKDGQVFKIEYPYNQKNVYNMSKKMNEICETYLKNMKVYYSIIPDKNYFIRNDEKRLFIDYNDMVNILNEKVEGMEYIDIFSCLTLDDYYKTDIHWKQEKLGKVFNRLGKAMQFSKAFDKEEFEEKIYSPFYGAYYGQAALPIKPDRLTYLTNAVIEGALVDNFEFAGEKKDSQRVYATDKLTGIDSYDVFLSGATPLISLENPQNNSGRELIIFRDSFGSSLAPLLLSEYSKITLIDLRYMSSAILGEVIDFNKQDVLFLYNTSLVNNSMVLK